MALMDKCKICGGIKVCGDWEDPCICRRDEDNAALAKAVVDEFFKRLPDRLEFRTYGQAGDSAKVYGDYITVVDLVEEED